ncbi:MAG TPA: hypothetical protein VNI36_01395 [Candidatus Dormibacteraeota bacterium]|nr:hypothetical protein [Candidatus Dormibacteraeota bacterium]
MQNRRIAAIATFAVALIICSTAHAQDKNAAATQPPKTDMKGAVPDLTGVWYMKRGNYDFASFSKGDPPMTAWGRKQFLAAKPSQGPRSVPLQDTNDMVYKCYSPGMPYIYLQLFPVQIVQTPTEVIELFEYDHSVRHIHLNSKHPDVITPTYMGDSIGHYEGDTLVVDTVGLNGKTWLDRLGHPNSDQMHIIEHIRRTTKTNLRVDFTFEDPKSYTRTWTAEMNFLLHPNWHIMEDMCMDNIAFEKFEK